MPRPFPHLKSTESNGRLSGIFSWEDNLDATWFRAGGNENNVIALRCGKFQQITGQVFRFCSIPINDDRFIRPQSANAIARNFAESARSFLGERLLNERPQTGDAAHSGFAHLDFG